MRNPNHNYPPDDPNPNRARVEAILGLCWVLLLWLGVILALTWGAEAATPATFTPYNPTPHAAEVDLDGIIAPYLADGYVRIPDDLDTVFPVVGYQPLYLIAWEDLPMEVADNDFNDVVLMLDVTTWTFQFIAGYSADTHTWSHSDGVLYLDSGQVCCPTGDFSSLSQPDRMLTWGKPPEVVHTPEPTTVALLGASLLWLGYWRRHFHQDNGKTDQVEQGDPR